MRQFFLLRVTCCRFWKCDWIELVEGPQNRAFRILIWVYLDATQSNRDNTAASEDILLPFQLDRLKQIRWQAEFRAGGIRAIESAAFAELLNITPGQECELHKKAAEAEEKLDRESQGLRQKRHLEVLEDVLTKKQLELLDESLGKPMSDVSK